jgi:hypothetical protein
VNFQFVTFPQQQERFRTGLTDVSLIGCWILGAGCGLQVIGCGLQDAEYRLQVAGCGLQDAGYRMQVTGYWLRSSNIGLPSSVFGLPSFLMFRNTFVLCKALRKALHKMAHIQGIAGYKKINNLCIGNKK